MSEGNNQKCGIESTDLPIKGIVAGMRVHV
jgi:hypothetical protein